MKYIFKIYHVILFTFYIILSCSSNNNYDNGKGVTIGIKEGRLIITPMNNSAVRVQTVLSENLPNEELIYTENIPTPNYEIKETNKDITLLLEKIIVVFDKKTETLIFKNENNDIFLKEKTGGRFITPALVQNENTYLVEQQFISPEDEYLFGTGQFQDGYLNIRGLSRRLTQVNTQIAIPFVLSNKGYGLLWNNYGLTDFNPADNYIALEKTDIAVETVTVNATGTSGNQKETRNINSFIGSIDIPATGKYSILLDVGQKMARKHYLMIDGEKVIDINNVWLPPTSSLIVDLEKGKHEIIAEGEKNDKPILYWKKVTDETVFRSPVANALDYTVFAGNGDQVIKSYRELTGPSPMMPLWALGYIHCRERYNTQSELLDNAQEFRKRNIPLDVIVQDWQWWGKHGWNSMQFDEDKYPNPKAMVDELKQMNTHLMISVWSKVDKNSILGKKIEENGYYIANTDWVDFFDQEAADFYWQNFSTKLLKPYKIDAWWQDATEPENDDLINRKVRKGTIPGEMYRNVYPLFVNKTVYNGLRSDDPNRRTMILTRSGFSGMQRYATATWSGDVGHDWETLRRQIAGGLGQMATGLPWWTYDSGGFFRPFDQYTNKSYHEQLIRWVQACTFFPLFRTHGYMSNTEPWRYGTVVENVITDFINLRYRLLPYIYSNAANVTFNGGTLMKPLVFDFPNDHEALSQNYEFMFGNSLLINPITEPGVDSWQTYLPENDGDWYDFWDGKKYKSGQYINTNVDINKIPVFVKGGSIIPFNTKNKMHSADSLNEPIEIHIYPGKDAQFTLYDDEGINYNYEKGLYSTIKFSWEDKSQTLSIDNREGNYPDMEQKRYFTIITPTQKKSIDYDGSSLIIKLNK